MDYCHCAVVFLASLRLGQADAGVFGIGETAAGHNLMREATIWPEHGVFGGNAALVAGTLHQHTRPVDVSRREDMRYIALQVVVDRDITAFGHHASGRQVKRIHIARPASRKEDRAYGQAGWTLLLAVV